MTEILLITYNSFGNYNVDCRVSLFFVDFFWQLPIGLLEIIVAVVSIITYKALFFLCVFAALIRFLFVVSK